MAELADALDSGSSDRKVVEVQVLSSAPIENKKLTRPLSNGRLKCFWGTVTVFVAIDFILGQHGRGVCGLV